MKIIEQSYEILNSPEDALKMIELAGRTCYKSEDKITEDSAPKFVKMLKDRGHIAMIEFGDLVVRFITNRGVTHELVRHRLCSFAQESTRYVNYGGKDMEFIRPVWFEMNEFLEKDGHPGALSYEGRCWLGSISHSQTEYDVLIGGGWRPEQAREVLPNSLKTEIVVKANFTEWRHILKLRTSKKAHPQMRALMIPLLDELKERVPSVFGDM
ncbi:FAD-dependent thymidylate synthase [Candidatus Pacearchaeota archaeon]|nr:FAD-dependent thymidylate synthase [Candidatus Pacearchaeota archaeon]